MKPADAKHAWASDKADVVVLGPIRYQRSDRVSWYQ
jgi:hypothetical protein